MTTGIVLHDSILAREVASSQGTIWVAIARDTAVISTKSDGTGIVLKPAFIVESAWEMPQVTQAAVHMDLGMVAGMARIVQLQRRVDDTVRQIGEQIYGSSSSRGSLAAALSDLVSYEGELMKGYDALLELLPPSR